MSGKIRITASLIVRNEAAFLEGCLASIAGLVDEIVVVDTGSTDGTQGIAARFGARVLDLPWRDDFSFARNAGLDAATGEWLLYIDADERLSVPANASLTDNLDAPDIFAGKVLFAPNLNGTPYREYRLFRNDPRLRFKGSMHETMLPDLDALIASDGVRVVDSPASILHLGYEGDLTPKRRRNLPLLRAALEQNPDRLYYWNHLAETLMGLGEREEALAVSTRGLELAITRSDGQSRRLGAMLAYTNGQLLLETGGDALPIIERGLDWYPGNRALLLLKARTLVKAGQYDEALAILATLTAENAATFCDPALSYDRRIFGSFAHDLTGVALLRLGRRTEAAAAFSRAAAAEPGNPAYRIKAMALGLNPATPAG